MGARGRCDLTWPSNTSQLRYRVHPGRMQRGKFTARMDYEVAEQHVLCTGNSDFKILLLNSVSQIMAPPSRESEERSKAAKHQSHLLRQSSSKRKLSLWPKVETARERVATLRNRTL